MTSDLKPLVAADGVARTFGRGPAAVVAVHSATCQVLPGDLIALVGPSGSGKSTLLHLLAGLDQPTVGTISWPALGARPTEWRAGTIGLVFQGPSLLPDLDVAENVAFPLLLAGQSETDASVRAMAMLSQLDLEDLARQLPEELSGGQAQRVAVARALVGQPMLVLADEPTGQLDHDSAAVVVELLIRTAGKIGAGLVISTHDPVVAAQLSEQWTMVDGRPVVPEPARC
jgi:ABC-type lipoprotein export system ATPase subunit